MDIRIYALLLLFAFVGSNAEFRPSARHRRDVERKGGENYDIARIIKRAADSTTTTTTKSTEDSTSSKNKKPGTTTPSTASPGTASPTTTNPGTASPSTASPSTASPTTTKATPATTPKPTKPTSGTTEATTAKSDTTPTETTTKPTTEATSKPELGSRSAFEEKNDSPSKPTNSDEKPEKKPSAVSPRIKPDTTDNKEKSPSSPSMLNSGNPSAGGGYPFPGFNSIPPYGPNYAFTSTNNSPGGSASASASSFASAGASSGNPGGYPMYDSRGGFYSNNPFYTPNGYTPGNTWPINDIPQSNPTKPITSSRSSFDADDKPKSTSNTPTGNNAHPFGNPNSIPSIGPLNFPSPFYGGPYTPNFDYPAANTAQGPNYAWTNSGPGYAGASAGASFGSAPSFNSRGAFPDNNAGMGYMDNPAYSPGIIDPGFNFPQTGFGQDFGNDFAAHQRMMEDHFRAIQAQIEAQQRAIFEANNGLGSGPGSSDPGLQSAISSISVGPGGGFQAGQINPAAPGIESRFANELPPPSGGQYGVFASSHSSSATDGSGKTIAHKSATTGVNDNGKITFRTVQDK